MYDGVGHSVGITGGTIETFLRRFLQKQSAVPASSNRRSVGPPPVQAVETTACTSPFEDCRNNSPLSHSPAVGTTSGRPRTQVSKQHLSAYSTWVSEQHPGTSSPRCRNNTAALRSPQVSKQHLLTDVAGCRNNTQLSSLTVETTVSLTSPLYTPWVNAGQHLLVAIVDMLSAGLLRSVHAIRMYLVIVGSSWTLLQ